MSRHLKKLLILVVFAALLVCVLAACDPVETQYQDKYPILDNTDNEINKDHTTKDQAIDRAVDSMENLLTHLDSDVVSTTGYYVGSNVTINTENGSAFILNLKANLYTYPYEIKDENGNVKLDPETGLPLVDEVALAKHNDLIRYSDVILEWYDGSTNEMLIGFYFDGINPNSADAGNDLYLNLQGSKRIFEDFGDSVLYQQLIRLITHFNLETVIGSASEDGTADSSFQSLRDALDLAITTNYKQTLNGDDATIFFNNVSLNTLRDDVTEFVQSIFSPYEDKLDPLSNKYLGFLISTLGNTSFTTINSDMEFVMTPDENIDKEIMTALILDVSGDSEVSRTDPVLGTVRETVPYTAHIAAEYSVRVSTNIVFDKEGYTVYDYGNYEYTGDMYIPMLDLKLDVLLRTDMNEVDNSINKVFMQCRDLATDDLIIGLYYANELTYVDVQGLQDLYGGVKIEDIGLPKAYRGGFDLADTLAQLFDFVDTYIVIAVDNILYGESSADGESQYESITRTIIANMESTMKDENDPSSRATIQIKVDFELIRTILSLTSETGVDYTTEQLILLVNQQFNIDIESIAAILGLSVEELLEKSYFYLTYDVDAYSIRLEVYTTAEMTEDEIEHDGPKLIMRLDLYPQHIGEYVKIVFPSFDGFKPLEDVMTYSGYLEGQFIFAATEEVDLSKLLGSFMGDESGLNTPFILPPAADIYFTLYYDQYIREQILDNGRWTRKSRSAFSLYLYMVVQDQVTPLARVYANDVSLNTADPVEELGYVWLDYICIEGMPKFKVREDHFIKGFYNYMGYDFDNEDEDIVMGLTDIVQALMEDSWATFEPDVIRVTTSNETIKNFFRVDELIGTIAIQIGFKQRVFDIDQLEVTFAMYTVGELEDIAGDSVYDIELHDTIPVYFDFGTRVETRDFYFLYDENSIAVVNDQIYYMPSTKGLFMGVMRDYNVHVLTDMGRQKINGLVTSYYDDWEPLEPVPTTVAAYYGESNFTNYYNAEFKLHAVYDRDSKYYTVLNDLGYEVVYDLENDIYIIGLGSQAKYDKAFEFLNEDVKYYYKEYVNTGNVNVSYDLGMRVPGWYTVKEEGREEKILYNSDGDFYIVESDEIRQKLLDEKFGQKEVEVRVPDESTSDPDDYITETELVDATIYTRTIDINGTNFVFDVMSGFYAHRFVIEDEVSGETKTYDVLYYSVDNYFYIRDYADRLIISELVGSTRIDVPAWLDWDAEPYTLIDWDGEYYDKIDWNDDIFESLEWTDMDWEDMTINGGIFIAYVVIGEGKMATFRKNVKVKVLNREIDTDKYVNILTPDGSVVAPVADSIEIDPYIYLLYKAYYMNTLSYNLSPSELEKGFVTWFFEHYNDVTFTFTKIYDVVEGEPDENTPDEVGSFLWQFDDTSDGMEIYSEYDINNRHIGSEKKLTYLYTVFHNQVIALSVEISPRKLLEIWFENETEANTYTVDALKESTYTLPTDPVYIFEGADGSRYALDFDDFNAGFAYDNGDGTSTAIPALLSTLHEGFASVPLGTFRQLACEGGLSVIKWTNPVADNIKLVNVDEDGNVYPFKDSDTNVTTSFFDLANYMDIYRNWYYTGDSQEGWFFVETISLTVLAPDKVIGSRDYSVAVGAADPTPETVSVRNIQVADYYDEGRDMSSWGIFFVDPYDSGTWILPTAIYAHFDGMTAGTYDAYPYTVEWRNKEGDNAVHFDVINGVYYLRGVTYKSSYYFLEAEIGEGTNTLTIEIMVYNMSGYARDVEFTLADGEPLFLHPDDAEIDERITSTPATDEELAENPYQLNSYVYYVDTYARFNIPEELKITFADGTVRVYEARWNDHAPWVQNTVPEVDAALGAGNSLTSHITLAYSIRQKELTELVFAHAEELPEGATVSADVTANTIRLEGLKLNAEGLIDMGGTIYTPYDFFVWFFDDITASFSGFEPRRIIDAVVQAALPVFGTLDTQKLIEAYTAAYGQGIDIYIGQEKGAHDFTVIIELGFEDESYRPGVDFGEGQSAIIDYITIEAYNADNTPKYPDGYVFKDELQFWVQYADGSDPVKYGGDGLPLPELWSVACPDAETENNFWADDNAANRMPELTPYEQLDRISWERIMLGGGIWVSAMLDNSSRVYFYFASEVSPIGNRFHSAEDDVSPFKIVYGTITIQNIYDNYRLGSYVTPATLSTRIALGEYYGEKIIKTNIVWTRIATTEQLDAIDYRGTVDEDGNVISIPLAKATITGQEVTLYLKVLPCDVDRLIYDNANVDSARHFTSELRDDDGIITVNVDAYHNYTYAGNFVIPGSIKLSYAEDKRVGDGYVTVNHVFTYNNLTYYRSDGTQISAIGYDLNGHKLTALPATDVLPADTDRDVYLTATLRDGQLLKIRIHFLDKTVTDITSAIDHDSYANTLWIDPYSEEINVPSAVTLKFTEGEDLVYNVAWNIPSDFEVMYDTYRRVFGSDPAKYFPFTGVLGGFSGLASVDLLYMVKVYDRVMDTYELVAGKEDRYDAASGTYDPDVNAYHLYDDVFTAKASELPGSVLYNGGVDYALIWNFADADIVATGTVDANGNVRYILVEGHVYNSDRGQPVAIKVYIDSFTYAVIRKPTADGGYIIMEGDSLRFVISAITGYSSIDHYMVDFDVMHIDPETETATKVIRPLMFVPEGIDPASVDPSFDSATYAYRLYWNRAALNEASRLGEAKGPFYFGNVTRSDIVTVGSCIYQYEMPNVLQLDFGYGKGTQQNAIYVVNPFDPDFNEREVLAWGTYNNEYDVSLNDAGLVAKILWNTSSIQRITSAYLAGGVIRDFTVTVQLTNPDDPDFVYTQSFDVMLVLLDMSPTTYINNQYANRLTSARVKTNYNAATYYGAATNPYKDVYLTHLINVQVTRDGVTDNVLNTAVRDLGLEGATFTYDVTEWDSAIYNNAGTRTQYSKQVTVNGRSYATNIVYRQWNASYDITGLDLGFGAGIDSADYDQKESQNALEAGDSRIIYVVNPLVPGDFVLTPVSVTGTYNGADINATGFTFEVIWWDEATSGSSFAFEGRYLKGGYIDYWKVVVKVINGADVVYTQVVNIMLVMLDMLPADRTSYTDTFRVTALPRVAYDDTAYAGKENPYGDRYASVKDALRSAVTKYNVDATKYTYYVDTWREPEVAGEVTVSRSHYIVVSDENGNTEIGRYECDGIVREIQ